jgi:hypothetical protein
MFVFGTINQLLTDYEDNNEHIFPTDAFPMTPVVLILLQTQ